MLPDLETLDRSRNHHIKFSFDEYRGKEQEVFYFVLNARNTWELVYIDIENSKIFLVNRRYETNK